MKTVLVIDDEKINIMMIERLFKNRQDCKVISAMNEEEAYERLSENCVDLILLDLIMPDKDGLTLFKEITKIYDVKAALMTADLSDENIEKATSLGISIFIEKPIMPAVFFEKVQGII